MDHRVPSASEFMETQDGEELLQRLQLYQVFSKLYEHHRGLLDEVLSLEYSRSHALINTPLIYLQGVTLGSEVYLVTNLVAGSTQSLMQAQQTWVIGRDPQRVAIAIPDDRLSRCHAAIKYVHEQGFYLIDLNSRNGSYVNGELVRQFRLLQDGDRVRLGSIMFIFFHCRSHQSLPAIADEVESLLHCWNPLTTAVTRLIVRELAADEPTTKPLDAPLDATSRFLRTDPSID
ncbi:FHA domain-containing protein [Thermocoleostomius sinensis]|uniref:FHA domain-containing protein n=1 Tax=Thermocoleostomius sinensis A174 TaxID=2016057 RepID=A0A9E8ZBE3_9CYAN|nr:FHA domain-containing protein [Thermocoleostomius sinensis]WAL58752.1 FHA domain-containing protein [Thermocoleostomius sinensis A174]